MQTLEQVSQLRTSLVSTSEQIEAILWTAQPLQLRLSPHSPATRPPNPSAAHLPVGSPLAAAAAAVWGRRREHQAAAEAQLHASASTALASPSAAASSAASTPETPKAPSASRLPAAGEGAGGGVERGGGLGVDGLAVALYNVRGKVQALKEQHWTARRSWLALALWRSQVQTGPNLPSPMTPPHLPQVSLVALRLRVSPWPLRETAACEPLEQLAASAPGSPASGREACWREVPCSPAARQRPSASCRVPLAGAWTRGADGERLFAQAHDASVWRDVEKEARSLAGDLKAKGPSRCGALLPSLCNERASEHGGRAEMALVEMALKRTALAVLMGPSLALPRPPPTPGALHLPPTCFVGANFGRAPFLASKEDPGPAAPLAEQCASCQAACWSSMRMCMCMCVCMCMCLFVCVCLCAQHQLTCADATRQYPSLS